MAGLRFGTFLAPNMLRTYQAIADAVGDRLGLSTELVVEDDYAACTEDRNDVCFVCSLPYITFERAGEAPSTPVAAPVLMGDRYGGRPIYFSDVIVHRDHPAAAFLDLRGGSWAYNEPLSQSGYGVTRHHLLMLGETNGFFGSVVEAGFHETSIEMVRERRVDASAIDSQVLDVSRRLDPSLDEDIRVIHVLGPSTIQPIAVTNRFSPSRREAIREALCGVAESPAGRAALREGLIETIVPVGPADYDDVRAMLDACEAANFMEIG